jgi:uncharacterized protein
MYRGKGRVEGNESQTMLEVNELDIRVLSTCRDAEPATLTVLAGTYIDVWVNDGKVTGRCTISPADKITVKLYDTPSKRDARVNVAPDGLQAMLHVEYEPGMQRRMVPVSASDSVTVDIEELPIHPEPFTIREIQQILQDEKVSYQVDYGAIAQLIGQSNGGECMCSIGIPPKQTIPERYEMLVTESNDVTLIGIMPVHPVLSVVEGTEIAQYLPRTEGVPGVDVRGEPIAPDKVVSKLASLGKGTERQPDGQVVATRSGRVIATTHALDVAETLVIESDLQATDGMIVFDGDVVIRGDVTEGTEIVAGGSVFVSGSISRTSISADEGIVVSGGAFGATLRAGLRVSALARMCDLLNQLVEELSTLAGAVEQVQTTLLGRGVELPAGKIAAKLMDEKFQSIRDWPARIEGWLRDDGKSAGATWSSFVESLMKELLYAKITAVRNVSEWRAFCTLLSTKMGTLNVHEYEVADIQVRNAQNSDIQATGSIFSTNQGYYQCHLSAGKMVRAQGNPGVILACSVVAGDVVAREIGSQAETNTTVQLLNTDGSVHATLVHPGTMLTVGGWRHKVSKEMKNVTWP